MTVGLLEADAVGVYHCVGPETMVRSTLGRQTLSIDACLNAIVEPVMCGDNTCATASMKSNDQTQSGKETTQMRWIGPCSTHRHAFATVCAETLGLDGGGIARVDSATLYDNTLAKLGFAARRGKHLGMVIDKVKAALPERFHPRTIKAGHYPTHLVRHANDFCQSHPEYATG